MTKPVTIPSLQKRIDDLLRELESTKRLLKYEQMRFMELHKRIKQATEVLEGITSYD